MHEHDTVQLPSPEPPTSLAGHWFTSFADFLGFWTADDGSEFGIWRSEDLPHFKMMQRLCGCSAIDEDLMRFVRQTGLYMFIAEDLSFLQYGYPGYMNKLSLDGSRQTWRAPMLPTGLSTFRCTSCSNSLIAFEFELPLGSGRLSGDLKLSSDGSACYGWYGEEHVMTTVEFQRMGSGLQGVAADKWQCVFPEQPENHLPSAQERPLSMPDSLPRAARLLKRFQHVPSTAWYPAMLGLAAAVVWFSQG
mmetsp:Transcript_89513/g.158901  ORF Transcript_89513/g.158901 Transcript_89513/m.158901 type:complete len:248 (-) Transcript_89513:43-786(-)